MQQRFLRKVIALAITGLFIGACVILNTSGDKPVTKGIIWTDDAEPITYYTPHNNNIQEGIDHPWWNKNWSYRKSFTISQTNGANENYNFYIKVHYNDTTDFTQFSSDGAWCWFSDPRAVQYNGNVYTGWITSDGDVTAAKYNLTSDTKTTFILHENLQVDDHDNPSILIRNDSHIMYFYSKHGGSNPYYRISTNPEDISFFGSEQEINLGSGCTYTYPVQLSKEDNKIFLFYRRSGSTRCVNSTDNGQTWGSETEVMSVNGVCPYMKLETNSTDTMWMAWSEWQDPGDADPVHNDTWFARYTNGSFYKADGALIGHWNDLPLNKYDCDMIYNSSDTGHHRCWIWDIAVNETYQPTVVFATFPDDAEQDHRYNLSYWNGTNWMLVNISKAGTSLYYPTENDETSYSGGIYLDHENTSIVYLSRNDIFDNYEIQKVTTLDNWSTFSFTNITNNSEHKDIRPVTIRNHTDDMILIWLHGPYTTYTNYDTEVMTVKKKTSQDSGHHVYLDEKCKPDFSDLRVTTDAGLVVAGDNTGFMCEKKDSDTCKIWFKIPGNLSTSNQTFYLYYGNNASTWSDNPNDTFVFFDHFYGSSLDDSNWIVQQGDVSVSNGNLILTGTTGTRGLIDSSMNFSIGKAVHTRMNSSGNILDLTHWCSFRETGSWDNRGGDVYGSGPDRIKFETTSNGSSTDEAVSGTMTFTNENTYEVRWNTANATLWINDDLRHTTITNVSTVNNGIVYYEGGSNSNVAYIEWMFVRNHTNPEPVINKWDEEQIGSKVPPFVVSLSEEWNIISASCYESISTTDIIVRNNSHEYSWSKAVSEGIILGCLYDYNRTNQIYNFSDSLEPGYGYWIWAYYDCELLIISNSVGTGHITDLKNGWDIMSLPYNTTIAKTNTMITNDSIDYTWDDAVSNNIIIGFVYGWNSTDQIYELYDNFNPGRGYWMFANQNCTLRRSRTE